MFAAILITFTLFSMLVCVLKVHQSPMFQFFFGPVGLYFLNTVTVFSCPISEDIKKKTSNFISSLNRKNEFEITAMQNDIRKTLTAKVKQRDF